VNDVFEIGPFRLDPEAGALTRAGKAVGLGPRAVAVLGALVERANEYVTRASLIDAAWPDVIVEEANLAVQISAIRRVLAQAPGGEHWVETLARRGYRFVGPVTRLSEVAPKRSGGEHPRSNLPAPLTSFVGRERELVEVKRLLSRSRLLTLVGIGGIGKTRLALQAAAEVVDAYRDGVWFVDLAPLAGAALVPSAVAQVLAVRETAGTPLVETLCGYVRGRQLLLVLDNCEHLLAGCATLADALLRGAPELSIIATSRELLRVAGEQTYPLATLSLPDPAASAETMSRSEAVQLFVERAEKQQPGFALTAARAAAIAQLCIHLDGIPLALELAAARIRSLSVEEINARLHDRFKLLTGGSRTALPRQQTLRSSIDWSYKLLSSTERGLLNRLTVFGGGWTMEAAEHVCSGDGIEYSAVLDLLGSLVDKSLVAMEDRNGAPRYLLLETMREYARARLHESGEEARWRRRHLTYFRTFAQEAEPNLIGPAPKAWLDRLEAEHDNLRSALAWSCASADSIDGLQLVGALFNFWFVRGHFTEGRRWLSTLLAAVPAGQTSAARAKALYGAGLLAWQQGDYPAARSLYEQSLAIHRQLGNQKGIANALDNLGLVAENQGDFSAARALHEESLDIYRQLGDQKGIAGALQHLALATHHGDFIAARALHEQSLAIYRQLDDRRGIANQLNNLGIMAKNRGDLTDASAIHGESLAIRRELGDRRGIAGTLNNLGMCAYERGDFLEARSLLGEGLAICRELSARRGIAIALHNTGIVACEQGDYADARSCCEESMAIFRELGEWHGVARVLETLANVAYRLAGPTRAARVWGGTERLREEIGMKLNPNERRHYDRPVAAARTTCGNDAAFDLAWQEGRAMALEQLVQYALEGKDICPPDQKHDPPRCR